MTKIMLVEDDNNLREIYEARLLAEGYEIVSAKDGEEALAMAVKEKPDLIISDIMMPKISGFDMLDILRSTPETKNTKVIMMTALSQAEDKNRADKLGADRYLVKSQVTLEDVAKVAREVLGGEEPPVASATAPATTPTSPTDVTPTAPATSPVTAADATETKQVDEPTTAPAAAADTPVPNVTPAPSSGSTQIDPALAATLQEEEAAVDAQINGFAAKTPADTSTPPVSPDDSSALEAPMPIGTELATPPAIQIDVKDAPSSGDEAPAATATDGKLAEAVGDIVNSTEPKAEEKPDTTNDGNVPIAHKKVIEPINDLTQNPPNLSELMAKEDQKEAISPVVQPETTLPAEAVIQPGGATVTPSEDKEDNQEDKTHKPGNIITPGGGTISDGSQQPSDIAL